MIVRPVHPLVTPFVNLPQDQISVLKGSKIELLQLIGTRQGGGAAHVLLPIIAHGMIVVMIKARRSYIPTGSSSPLNGRDGTWHIVMRLFP